MGSIALSTLVDRLSYKARSSLEKAASIASSRSHYSIEIIHWLLAMLIEENTNVRMFLTESKVDIELLERDINIDLEKEASGCQTVPGLSSHTVTILKNALMSATVEFSSEKVEELHILYSLITDETLFSIKGKFHSELKKINVEDIVSYCKKEENEVNSYNLSENGENTSLNKYTIDLTEQARLGKIDPVIGREGEIRLMIDILSRRRQNNPILTGDSGVGKTAVVEGLALKITELDVPPNLHNVSIKVLDLALLQAGAGMKGEFENRLKSVIKDVNDSSESIIIFIDEAHGLIGSGSSGQNDAANILKPALARGELRTIAATTWSEYKKYIEKDSALTRRFQVVKVEEPSPEVAIKMLMGLVSVMERHHNVQITNEALRAAVNLSSRYINSRQLPDKAISLLDTACSRVSLSQSSIPGPIDSKNKEIKIKELEIKQLEIERKFGKNHDSKLEEINKYILKVNKELDILTKKWENEKKLVNRASEIKKSILTSNDIDKSEELIDINIELSENKCPLVYSHVDEELIANVISDWTGIPIGSLNNDEITNILGLEDKINLRIIGQKYATHVISDVIKTARANLSDESKPNGVFFLVGPSGVGKTETALAIAEHVYGCETNITTINMSEFKEEHKVSLLLGSPPGYIGYGEGGVLTEAVRRKPYSVILLDEMEKAHPGVQDIFYQVFDKGVIKDGEGRDIDFKNTVIIMTSNSGTETTVDLFQDPELAPDGETLRTALHDDLLKDFKPAFLGRVNIIPYIPLSSEVLNEITKLKVGKIAQRIKKNYGYDFICSSELIDSIVDNSKVGDSGARAIQNVLENKILPLISNEILLSISNDKIVDKISINGSINNILVSVL